MFHELFGVRGGLQLVNTGQPFTGALPAGQAIRILTGALVPEGMEVPAGSLVAGVPAKVKKQLDQATIDSLPTWAHKYQKVARAYMTGTAYQAGFINGKGAD